MKNFLPDWILQRVTAAVMALYTPVVVIAAICCKPEGYAGWKSFFSSGAIKVATLIFVAALLYHAWVGIRDILIDYVKPDAVRLLGIIAVAAALVGYLGWAVRILWGA